jgi:hypothetical protein
MTAIVGGRRHCTGTGDHCTQMRGRRQGIRIEVRGSFVNGFSGREMSKGELEECKYSELITGAEGSGENVPMERF